MNPRRRITSDRHPLDIGPRSWPPSPHELDPPDDQPAERDWHGPTTDRRPVPRYGPMNSPGTTSHMFGAFDSPSSVVAVHIAAATRALDSLNGADQGDIDACVCACEELLDALVGLAEEATP
jgi:hypothetical protein